MTRGERIIWGVVLSIFALAQVTAAYLLVSHDWTRKDDMPDMTSCDQQDGGMVIVIRDEQGHVLAVMCGHIQIPKGLPEKEPADL